MNLIFATNNAHKVSELASLLPKTFTVFSLKEGGIGIEIPEPFDTLEENAEEKARTIHNLTGQSCFSEDTGLEVFSLGMEPGVKSARYAGEGRSSKDNMQKLLHNLSGKERDARFRTVICLILQGEKHFFEGICNGKISMEPSGEGGFGYDPVFIPEGAAVTFAQMTMEEKNRFSHRAKAVHGLVTFLNNLGSNTQY